MEKDFDNYVARRCEEALIKNQEYISMERDAKISQDEKQALAEMICYKQAIKDTFFIFFCSQNV